MHKHPDTQQLDMLRAGLLDDTPDTRRKLEQHVADCPACQARYEAWSKVTDAITTTVEPAGVQTTLRRYRQQALASAPSPRTRWQLVPVAAAAVLLVAVSFGIVRQSGHTVPRQATVTRTAQTVPDTIEDLDFYLWLANQDKGNRAISHHGSDNS